MCDHAAVSTRPPEGRRGISLRPSERLLPVRRLRPEECDAVGFAGPLVLARRQVRWLGLWRTTGGYVVVRHPDEVVLACSRDELTALGVEPGTDDVLHAALTRLVGRRRHRESASRSNLG